MHAHHLMRASVTLQLVNCKCVNWNDFRRRNPTQSSCNDRAFGARKLLAPTAFLHASPHAATAAAVAATT